MIQCNPRIRRMKEKISTPLLTNSFWFPQILRLLIRALKTTQLLSSIFMSREECQKNNLSHIFIFHWFPSVLSPVLFEKQRREMVNRMGCLSLKFQSLSLFPCIFFDFHSRFDCAFNKTRFGSYAHSSSQDSLLQSASIEHFAVIHNHAV